MYDRPIMGDNTSIIYRKCVELLVYLGRSGNSQIAYFCNMFLVRCDIGRRVLQYTLKPHICNHHGHPYSFEQTHNILLIYINICVETNTKSLKVKSRIHVCALRTCIVLRVSCGELSISAITITAASFQYIAHYST
jgi:hypothetical protein